MADTMTNVQLPHGVWVDIYTATGITVGARINCRPFGIVEAVVQANDPNATQPTGYRSYGAGEEFINDSGDSVWVRSNAVGGSYINVSNAPGTQSAANSDGAGDALRNYDNMQQPRLLTTGLTQAEIASIEGDRYSAQADFTLGSGDTQDLLFVMPPIEDGVLIGFISREVKSGDGIDFTLYWDPTGVTVGAPVPVFNENQAAPKVSKMNYNFATNVTGTPGELRESNFSNPAGGGPFSSFSGEISPDSGYRIYDPSREVLVRITNTGDAGNRVLLTYGWVEAPVSL